MAKDDKNWLSIKKQFLHRAKMLDDKEINFLEFGIDCSGLMDEIKRKCPEQSEIKKSEEYKLISRVADISYAEVQLEYEINQRLTHLSDKG